MKTFLTDQPYLRYALFFIGAVIASFTGAVAALLLFGVFLK